MVFHEEYKVVAWKAWFVDVPKQKVLKEFSSKTTEWTRLPRDGAVGFVLFSTPKDEGGRYGTLPMQGYDRYFRAKGMFHYIYGCDVDSREIDLASDIRRRNTAPSIIRGIWTDDATVVLVRERIQTAIEP